MKVWGYVFWFIQILYPIGKQIYKSELLRKKRIYDIFQMSLCEWAITNKEQVNDLLKLKAERKLDVRRNKESEVRSIKDSILNTEVVEDPLLRLYHLLFSKCVSKDDNKWEPTSPIIYFKMISIFYLNYFEKPIAKFLPLNVTSLIAKLTLNLITKAKNDK